jgi:hypothetical protein
MVTLKEKLKSWEACWEALDWLGDRTEAEALRSTNTFGDTCRASL